MPEHITHREHIIDHDHRSAPGEVIERPQWLTPEVWPYEVRTWRHRGQAFHYLDEGPTTPEAPTLVLVHAGMWSFIWRDLIDHLRPRFRCLSIDFPGAGLSPGGPDVVDLGRFADLLARWLDDLAIDRATFVLHDLGGVVGVTAAAARPERVEAIAAVNTFAWPANTTALRLMLRAMGGPTITATLGRLRVIPRLTRTAGGVGRHLDQAGRRAFYGPYAGRPDRGRGFHRAMASAVASTDLYTAANQALSGPLAHLPVLTVFGERNDPFGFADQWRHRFPQAQSHVVDGGNHFPMCDAPEQLAGWLSAWHDEQVWSGR